MALAAAALSAGIDALSALLSPSSTAKNATAKKTGFNAASAFNVSGGSSAGAVTSRSAGVSAPKLASGTFSALLEAQAQTPVGATQSDRPAALNKLFSALDSNGDGQIAKAEFQDKLGAGGTNLANADSVFGKLDSNGDGSIGIDELSAVLHSKRKHEPGRPDQVGGQHPLLKALQGASATSSTGSDGSAVTSVTYADGSNVTLTKPPAAVSAAAASSYNFVERVIEQQARYLSASSQATVKVSA